MKMIERPNGMSEAEFQKCIDYQTQRVLKDFEKSVFQNKNM